MYPLKLNVNPEGNLLFRRRDLDPQFTVFSQKVFNRDHFVCQFCGFQATEHQQILNLDQDYSNNKLSNLVTGCRFCMQCCFLESVGMGGYGGGVLIYLPEMAQNALNALCHVLFSAMDDENEYAGTAQNAYRHLRLRSQIIETEWGKNMQEPALFAQAMIESGDRSLLSKKIFTTVRLLSSRAAFRSKKTQDAPLMSSDSS